MTTISARFLTQTAEYIDNCFSATLKIDRDENGHNGPTYIYMYITYCILVVR